MHIRLSTFLLPLLSCLYISSIFFTTVHAQAFQDATGLSAANEFNFSTQFAQPDGGRPVVMVAEVTPQDELNFYGSNDDGATRSLISTIAQPGNSYGGNMINIGTNLIAGGCTFNQVNNLYTSTDNGISWVNTLTTGIDACIHQDFVELANGNILAFFGTYSNQADYVYRSTDGGLSRNLFFTFPTTTSSYKISAIQLSNGDLIYTQSSPFNPFGRIRRSTDNGATRTQPGTIPVASYNTSLTQAPNGNVLAAFAGQAGITQIRRSIDNGATRVPGGSPGGAVNYFGADLLSLTNGSILLDLAGTTTNDRTYISDDNGLTRTQITTRPIPVNGTNYDTDMFQLPNGELLISNPHRGARPVVLKHTKPPAPTLSDPVDGYTGCTLPGVRGTGSVDTNEIYYEVLDSTSTVVLSGTGPIAGGNFSIGFAPAFDTPGTYTVNVYEDDGITLSDPDTTNVTVFGESPTPYTISPGLITNIDETWQSISFNSFISGHTFVSTPIVIATPQTQSNGDNYPIPRIRNVTTTGFEISICLDKGGITCDPAPTPEDIGVFVVDVDAVACIDDIDTGITTIDTDGTDTAFAFSSAFTNEPYVFTTPQTASQGNNIAAVAWVDDNALDINGSDFVGCVHQNGNAGNIDRCTVGQPQEQLGWLAIDPALYTMPNRQDGTETISNSAWTMIGFAPAYVGLQPVVMVTQNSDNGGQDPQYAWAKNVTTTSADIRYCEADAQDVCNTHTNELVRRFSLPIYTYCGDGFTQSPNADGDTEQCDDSNNIDGDGCDSMCQLESTGDVCIYGPDTFGFSGTLTTQNSTQIIEAQFTGHFSVDDQKGADSGYYTTLQISNFTGTNFGQTLSNSSLERYASGVTLLSGDTNTGVVLATGRNSYRPADLTYTFLLRDPGTNLSKTGQYGALPRLRLTLPPYMRPDIYTATICYTLYEN